MASDRIRGLVIARWEEVGRPHWSVTETLEVAAELDVELETRALSPAPRFREARQSDERRYLKQWIKGCRFPWLYSPEASAEDRSEPAVGSGTNRRLGTEELKLANSLLDLIRSRIDELAGADERLRFAYRRKVAKELQYDERGKPTHRIRLKARKRRAQNGMCANDRVAPHELPTKGAVLDRLLAEDGYTDENTRLLCPDCDAQFQADKGYTDRVASL